MGATAGSRATVDVAALAAEHGAQVLAFAHRMLGNRADAEDATQEAFLRAHRQASTFQGECAPATWLYAIARNACLDRLRTRATRRFAALDDVVALGVRDAAAARPAPHGPADDAAERRRYVAAVREGCLLGTLACLTDAQRAAFVLRTLTDLSTQEAAVVLGRTPNAVRVLVHRARTRLKDFLCRSCSLWDAANPCRCENLVTFSLARGWIGAGDARADASRVADAAAVVDELGRLAAIYAAVPTPEAAADVGDRLRASLARLDALAR